MNNRANTKQALLSSVIALLLCFAMLFGTTFAWFTDEVTNANNIIKTGTLKVVATYGDSLTGVEDNNLENQGDTAPKGVFYYDNWEPGYTDVKYFRIKNDGSLAFKYQLNIVPTVAPVDGEVNLADVIDVYFVNPADKEYARDDFASMTPVATVAQLMAETDGAARGVLHPVGNKDGKASDITLAIALRMKETADNKYQDKLLGGGFKLQLLATQLTYEEDSFGPEYDEDAVYADVYATTAEELTTALAEGKSVALMSDIELDADKTITIPAGKDATLILNGNTLSSVSDTTGANRNFIDVRGTLTVKDGTITTQHTGTNMAWNNSTNVFNVTAGGVLNIENATVRNEGGSDMAFCVHLNNWGEVTLNVKNSTLFSTYIPVRAFNSGYDMNNIDITDSKLIGKYSFWVHNYTDVDFGASYDADAVDDRLNVNFLNKTKVEGAADPITLNTAAGNTYVGDIILGFTNKVTVGASSTTEKVASNDEALDTAIKGGATTVYLGSGNYIIPDSAQGKTLTIIGNGDTVVATQDDGSYEGCDYSLDGATVTFEGITINTDSTTYTGYARMKGTFNNCTINGTYTLYDNSTFNNCTFNVSGDVYNIWTWGAPNATFNNCTFNNDGKAILLYGGANTKLTLDKCVFNDKGGLTDLKAAVEVGTDWTTDTKELIVNNCTVNGYAINDKGINTGTTLWGNKNSMTKERLNVVIDGVDKY